MPRSCDKRPVLLIQLHGLLFMTFVHLLLVYVFTACKGTIFFQI
jgi:hypothetical protein